MLNDGHIHIVSGSACDTSRAALAEGAEKYAVLSLSQLWDDPGQNPEMLLAKALDPAHCFAFCGLDHPKADRPVPDPLEQVKAWLAAGFDGVKFIETKPNCQKATGVRLDDARFEPMFAYLEAHQIPVLWHNGDPATFWDPEKCPPSAIANGWAYTDGSFLSLQELYTIVENVLNRHPRLKVTLAHFYFVSDDPAHALRMMETYPNLRFDLTPGTEMYEGFTLHRDVFRDFFLKYASRLQLGTDTDVRMGEAYDGIIKKNVLRFLSTEDHYDFFGFHTEGYGLPEAVVQQIVSGTFESFVGTTPKAMDAKAAKLACEGALSRCAPAQKAACAAANAEIEKILTK